MSSQDSAPVIYQFRIWLRGISPTIWCRLLVRSDSIIAHLHYILQLVMGVDGYRPFLPNASNETIPRDKL